jgi:pyrroloquinoline quinone biosynthesis protein E
MSSEQQYPLTVYPRLKKQMGIKHLSDFDLVFDCRLSGGAIASRREAMLLALCGGVYDLATIVRIYAGVFNLDRESAETEVQAALDEFSYYLDILPAPTHEQLRYDPAYFLQDPPVVGRRPIAPRQETPTRLTFSLTHSCSYRCIHCINDSGKKRGDELPVEDWLRVIDEAADLGVMSITLSGGEPMLYPGFFALVQRMVERNIYPVISTNGSQLTPQMVKRLADLGVDYVHLSLPAVTETLYDRITSSTNYFPTVEQAIVSMKEQGFYIRAKAVLLPANLDEMEKLLDFCFELGVDFVHLCPFQLMHLTRGGPKFLLSLDQLKSLDVMAQEKLTRYGDKMMIGGPMLDAGRWQGPSDLAQCSILKTKCVILPDGNVTHCELLLDMPEFIIGSVNQASLAQIWCSEEADRLTEMPPDRVEEPCQSCEYLPNCRTGCYSCSLMISNNPWAVDPRCWKANVPNNPFELGEQIAAVDKVTLS